MKKYILIVAIITLIAVVPFSNLSAQRMKGGGGPEGGGRKGFLKELNLSQDQKDQIPKLRSDNQSKMVDMKAEIAKTRIQIKELMRYKDLDESKIMDLTKKISGIQADMKTATLDTWFKTYKLLNDNQKEVFRKHAPMLREKAGKMMRQRMGRKGNMLGWNRSEG